MSLSLVTAPTAEPVTLQEAKDHLRVDGTDEDTLISALITAAREHVDGRDGWLGRAICTQTWDCSFDAFPADGLLYLPLAPVQSITSVKYIDPDGVQQTFSSSNYALGADLDWSPRVVLGWGKSWPSIRAVPDAVTVRIVAGYASVPKPICQAILLLIGHLYENREASSSVAMHEVPFSVSALLAPYRRFLRGS